jgi:hypothetical protein
MMDGKAPWYGAILMALLVYVRSRYPDQQVLIDALIAALVGAWGGHVASK